MQRVYKTILVILVSVISSQAYSIGYVSRDCPAAGAKESISMDWSQRGEMFYTESMQLAKRGAGRYEWVKFTSGGWQLTWRSYAGQVLNYISNYYYSGVYGYHYRYNRITRRNEQRSQYVTSCNLLTWGVNNW